MEPKPFDKLGMRLRLERQHAGHPPLAPAEGPFGAIRQLHNVAICVHRMELPCLSVCRVAVTTSSTMRRATVLTVGVKEGVPATLVLVPGTAKKLTPHAIREQQTGQKTAKAHRKPSSM